MNILLTGVAGFIGSNLCEHLLKRGHFVIGVDNFNDFYDPRVKRLNIQSFLNSKNFYLAEGDITDKKFLDEVFKSWGIDAIIHFAAWAGVTMSFKKPLLYSGVNFIGTVTLLEMAAKYKIFDFILASSSSVYANSKRIPFKENFEIASKPVSIYAATKKSDEVIAYTYSSYYGIKVSCLRFFNAYGPRQRPDMAAPVFLRKTHSGKPLPLYQELDTSRDYTYIDDICLGVIASLENRFDYEIFNLGNSSPVKLGELVKVIEKVVGKKAIIKRMPERRGEVEMTFADISKAKKMLGYNPKTTLEEGIKKTYEWFLSTPQWYKDLP